MFTYVFVEDEHGEVLVFEIPERLHEVAEQLEDAVGCLLAISRDGTARNSRISIGFVGQEMAEKLDIWPFVDTLGKGREVPKTTVPNSQSFP